MSILLIRSFFVILCCSKIQNNYPVSFRYMKCSTRFIPVILILALGSWMVVITSCVKQESFPVIPQIGYEGFAGVFDTGFYPVQGILTISFQDGDGNIGLNSRDTLFPYQKGGPYYYNYVIKYFEKRDTGWAELVLDPPLSSRIPVLNPDYPGKAIKGIIVDTLPMNPKPDYDTIRFELYIYDRTLNKSNTIITPTYVLKRAG